MILTRGNCEVDHTNALGRKRLIPHGKRDDNIRPVGELTINVQKEFKLVETHLHLATIQHEDEGDRARNLPYQHLLSSQGLNFEEEIKELELLSSLPTSWEVFCTTINNNSSKLTLEDAIGAVLSEEL